MTDRRFAARSLLGAVAVVTGCGGESVHTICTGGWREIGIPAEFRPFYAQEAVFHRGRLYVVSLSAGAHYYPSAALGLIYGPDGGFSTMPDYLEPWDHVGSIVASVIAQEELIFLSTADPGGRYDTPTDTWAPVPEPAEGYVRSAVSMGDEIAISNDRGREDEPPELGFYEAQFLTYAPGDEGWLLRGPPFPELHAPALVWNGHEVIAWGGWAADQNDGPVMIGARFDPASDGWTEVSNVGAPTSSRTDVFWKGTWTGSVAVFWALEEDAGRYYPDEDVWRDVTPLGEATLGAPAVEARGHVVSWTNSAVSVYDPENDSWFMPSMRCGPAPRAWPLLVRVDGGIMMWGGSPATCWNSPDSDACGRAGAQEVYYLPDDALFGERTNNDASDCSCPPPQ